LEGKEYQFTQEEGWGCLRLPLFLEQKRARLDVQYWTGYGEDPAQVPPPLKHAILMYGAFLYENRGDEPMSQGISESIWALLQPYRVRHFVLSS
jgi:uncharacterized phiE125 gp8 family phage protein